MDEIDPFSLIIYLTVILIFCAAFYGLVLQAMQHLCAIIAIPLYLAMITIEIFTQNIDTRFFQFRRPVNESNRFMMNVFATLAVLIGILLLMLIYLYALKDPNSPLLLLQSMPTPLSILFLVPIAIVYGFNWFAPDDMRDPMLKLKELGVPGFIAKWLNTTTK